MYDVMQGVKVVEVAEHTFAPSAGVMLADWGADVIKVERTQGGGDPARSLRTIQRPGYRRNPYFEVANRGKRGIALDLTSAEGREYLYRLVAQADVFITNLRRGAREKLGIEATDLMPRNPRLNSTTLNTISTHAETISVQPISRPASPAAVPADSDTEPVEGGR